MDLLVPAPMPDICVRLWKNCPRPASHVVPRLTDRLHRDRTAILMPSTVRSSGAPPLVSDGKRLLLPSSMRSSGSPPFVSDFGKLPPYDRSPPSRQDGNTHAVHRAFLWFASNSTPTAKATVAVLNAFLWFASIRVRLWKTAEVRQVASIATGRQYSCRPLIVDPSCRRSRQLRRSRRRRLDRRAP